jgi:prolyl oligopeptidase PreP (S9A serine peptidase family)
MLFLRKVADPQRPLEDVDSEAARKWIEAENKLTFGRSSKKNLQLKIQF